MNDVELLAPHTLILHPLSSVIVNCHRITIVQRPVALAEDWMEYALGKTFNVTGWGTLSDSYVR